jgi:hypothetical protein
MWDIGVLYPPALSQILQTIDKQNLTGHVAHALG